MVIPEVRRITKGICENAILVKRVGIPAVLFSHPPSLIRDLVNPPWGSWGGVMRLDGQLCLGAGARAVSLADCLSSDRQRGLSATSSRKQVLTSVW